MEEQVVTKHTRSGLELQNKMLFDRLDTLLNKTSDDPDKETVISALMEAISENTRQLSEMQPPSPQALSDEEMSSLLQEFVLIDSSETKPAAETNSPPKKAFFEGLIRRNSDEEREAERAAKEAAEHAKFQASLRSATSSAEFDPELPGKQPKLSLLKISKK